MLSTYPAAPELAVSRWFNTGANPMLADLRGEGVVIEAFEMLCPGCVSHGLPQAKRTIGVGSRGGGRLRGRLQEFPNTAAEPRHSR